MKGSVTRMKERKHALKHLERKERLQDLGVYETKILKLNENLIRFVLVSYRVQWRDLVNKVINIRILKKAEILLLLEWLLQFSPRR